MAREHAQVKLSIWDDDDFLDLSLEEQHLYLVLATSRSLSYCGVADWRPNRIAKRARGWAEQKVCETADALMQRLYILVDEETEEVLVRSFVRHDGLMKQPKMATAMASAYASVASRALRGVVVHELVRLREDEPDLKGWGSERATDLLSRPSVNPSTYPLGKGSVKGSINPSVKGKPKGSTEGSTKGSPTPYSLLLAPTPAPFEELRSSPTLPPEVNGGTVVAAWVDASKANGVEPSKSQIGQVGKLAKELLAKNDHARVLEAAASAGAKGYASIDRELTVLAGRNVRPITAPRRQDPKSGIFVERS